MSNKEIAGEPSSGTKRKETVREGEDIELLCAVDANPAATDVLWMYEVGSTVVYLPGFPNYLHQRKTKSL